MTAATPLQLEELLPRITWNTEVVAMMARRMPMTIYRVHVRVDGHWYEIKDGVRKPGKGDPKADPIADMLSFPPEQRVGMLCGQLHHIVEGYSPMGKGVERLIGHARGLLEQARAQQAATA